MHHNDDEVDVVVKDSLRSPDYIVLGQVGMTQQGDPDEIRRCLVGIYERSPEVFMRAPEVSGPARGVQSG